MEVESVVGRSCPSHKRRTCSLRLSRTLDGGEEGARYGSHDEWEVVRAVERRDPLTHLGHNRYTRLAPGPRRSSSDTLRSRTGRRGWRRRGRSRPAWCSRDRASRPCCRCPTCTCLRHKSYRIRRRPVRTRRCLSCRAVGGGGRGRWVRTLVGRELVGE